VASGSAEALQSIERRRNQACLNQNVDALEP
jgi:hypothetical protein